MRKNKKKYFWKFFVKSKFNESIDSMEKFHGVYAKISEASNLISAPFGHDYKRTTTKKN